MRPNGSALALGLSTMAMMASFVIWSVFSPIAGQIQELFHLSTIQKSVLIATPVLLGSILRIPMGIYTDRFGGKRVFASTMLFLVIPLLLAGWVHSYWLLLLCALFIGMAGTTFAISLTYVSRWFPPERQGFVLGLAGLGNLGGAAASYALPFVFNIYGLQWVFWSLAIMIVIVTALFWIGTKDLPAPSKVKTFKQSMVVLKEPSTWYLSIFYFLTFGGFVAFSVYLPTFLKDLFQLSATEAGVKTAGFVVIATLIRPLGGYLADRIGSRRVLVVVFGGIIITSLAMSASLHQFAGFSASCLVAAALLGVGNGAVFKMVPEVSSGNTGAVTGIVGAAGGVGGFFPPIVLGIIKDLSGAYTLGFVMLMLFACGCLYMNHATKRMVINKQGATAV
ncbi:NNP family nitrate/nitrite transporter-like MFS transporter [Paenibacillus sp. V4I3]|uniref:MFS transporter n=1 Tax=unclassified Paenibacillus TaxID=185978 RepID=UPI0027825B6A|nr:MULTISPECIES: MFS transporter [unclassified Paenibacillus]MDQ0871808.1 NNP family nitrate/nitrite transporter-like MFS transporter [Paenibacillus sp. V4I3]MDQ0892308.1 NNP family nitrate/nitrite transporter-like MFS transporter [Paenibacillus sp. V4I9]